MPDHFLQSQSIMEKLSGIVHNEVLEPSPDMPSKDYYLCSVGNIELLSDEITPSSQHFCLFLALDAKSLDDGKIREVAKRLLQKGLVYLCAWGPDCERVHDLFDYTILEMDPQQDRPVVMTTWHTEESFQEAVWFFINAAFPDEAYVRNCHDWMFAPIGNPGWEKVIRESQSSGAA
jgi:hypothetical protein